MLIAGAYFASASQAAQGTEFFVEYGLPSFLAVAPEPLWFSALESRNIGSRAVPAHGHSRQFNG
jgi:hypothetical protein